MTDRLVGIREASERLGLTQKELQTKCRASKSPVRCAKRGDGPRAVWVFLESDLTRYISGLFGGETGENSGPEAAR